MSKRFIKLAGSFLLALSLSGTATADPVHHPPEWRHRLRCCIYDPGNLHLLLYRTLHRFGNERGHHCVWRRHCDVYVQRR